MISSCINTLYNLCTDVKNIPDTYGSRILRICVFQHAENAGIFERTLIRVYKFFSQGICSTGYDAERAQRGRAILEQLGAEFLTIPVDGNSIDAMEWHSQVLEDKINALGGCWKQCTLSDGQQVLAIRPPSTPSKEWAALERNLLQLNWPQKEGLIITCPSAELIKDEGLLFIQLNSASTSYVMMRKRMGFLIGCRQAVVAFDPPGTGRSTGIPTEGAYYSTIRAIFEKLANHYIPAYIWVCGACLGSVSAAYLRSQVTDINLLLENGFVNLQEDMIKPEGRFVYWFAQRYWESLFGQTEKQDFNVEKIWSAAPHSNLGKVVVVSVENDQRLAPQVALNLVELARQISANVTHIPYLSQERDPHFSRFENAPEVSQVVLSSIFN